MRLAVLVLAIALPSLSMAKSDSKSSSSSNDKSLIGKLSVLFPHPMVSVQYGDVDWGVKKPSEFQLDKGWTIEGQFAFDIFLADLIVGYKYLTFGGKANYRYQAEDASAPLIKNSTETTAIFSAPFLALKIPIGWFPLHPYIEGGAEVGLAQLKYPKLESTTSVIYQKTAESQAYSAAFGEVGIELVLFKKMMLSASARYTKVNSTNFETMNDQPLLATGMSYLGGLGVRY